MSFLSYDCSKRKVLWHVLGTQYDFYCMLYIYIFLKVSVNGWPVLANTNSIRVSWFLIC